MGTAAHVGSTRRWGGKGRLGGTMEVLVGCTGSRGCRAPSRTLSRGVHAGGCGLFGGTGGGLALQVS